MTSSSSPSLSVPLTGPHKAALVSAQRQQLRQHMTECRASTLAVARQLSPTAYYRQAHPDFSPVGWHLGHIAFTEALWILAHLAGQRHPLAEYRQLFAADGLPKTARQQLPDLPVVINYLAEVREQVFQYLAHAPLESQLRLWWWLLQHESQHLETISIVLAMHRRTQGRYLLSDHRVRAEDGKAPAKRHPPRRKVPMVALPAAEIVVGYDGIDAIDNEHPTFTAHVAPFCMDVYPVTQGAFREFIAAGGYDSQSLWSAPGWSWRLTAEVDRPLYWPKENEADKSSLDDHPVCGVSYYEAEAYANFVGKRLPTELEWERAACWSAAAEKPGLYPWGDTWPTPGQGNFGGGWGMTTAVGTFPAGRHETGCQDLLGNVWEWTSSWFEGYAGFRAFPYRGYSAVYFDGQHRVLRGGSWATRPWALRGTLRNWYYPHVREIFAGFRCVADSA